jgi:Family of unknown function (DUF5995)
VTLGGGKGTEGDLLVRTRTKTIVAAVVAAVTLAMAMPASAALLTGDASDTTEASRYDDPFFLNWPVFVPGSTVTDYAVSTSNECKHGQINCVDRLIDEMTRRYNALGCDHDSTFAFTYLLTTQEYRRAVEDPAFFSDNAFINHQDAVFGEYYFDQFDDWRAGRTEQVSPAWRIAFHASQNQEVAGMGSLFLGMNAHVNRDLPFVLAEIGLIKPDGTSRKPDHDRVNDFLATTNQYLLTEAAKFLDPSLDDLDVPGVSVDNSTMVQALVLWREQAWQNAERLVAADTEPERAAVARQIEEVAALEALAIREAFRYGPTDTLLRQDAAARNRFCAANFEAR